MEKIDYKAKLKHLYHPSAKSITVVDVPRLPFLMAHGQGNPNTSQGYSDAVAALFSVSYTLKFMVKKQPEGIDYAVMPLECLWWADDPEAFLLDQRDEWQWTATIMQPHVVDADLVAAACEQVASKKQMPVAEQLEFSTFEEGAAAQILYIGPYSDEGPTIQAIHRFIEQQGCRLSGKHHEIYLNDPSRTRPEKLKTIIRQPFVPA